MIYTVKEDVELLLTGETIAMLTLTVHNLYFQGGWEPVCGYGISADLMRGRCGMVVGN